LAILTASTSLLYPIISYLPFFSWIRFGLHLYLLLPGEQQGAAYIYRNHVDPWFRAHDKDIEHLISTGHDRIKTAGLDYFKRALAFVKAQLLGMQESSSISSSSPARASTSTRSGPAQQKQGQTQNYAQSLLARFSLPDARPATAASSSTNTSAAVDSAGFATDGGSPNSAAMYSLLSSALQAAAATGMISSPNAGTHSQAPSTPVARAPALTDPADRAKYAEGLRALLKAFDRPSVGHDGVEESGSSISHAPTRVGSPPTDFEAIEHEDAKGSELGEQEKPVMKRRSTSGSGWGGWMWGGRKEVLKEKDELTEKVVIEEGKKVEVVESVS
jgi:receptor expression-enhancing protein 1/2/3/4